MLESNHNSEVKKQYYGNSYNKAEAGAGIAQAVAKGYAAEAPFKAIVLGVYTQVQYEMPPLRK